MEIRPYQGSDEAALLNVWQQAMPHDRIDEAIFRTKVLLDPNFQPENLPVADSIKKLDKKEEPKQLKTNGKGKK